METSLKNKSINESPSPTKKPKQLTLLELSARRQLSVSNKGNRGLSPQFKSNEKNDSRKELNSADEIECQTIDSDPDVSNTKKTANIKVKKQKENKENSENHRVAVKNVPKKQVPSKKALIDKSSKATAHKEGTKKEVAIEQKDVKMDTDNDIIDISKSVSTSPISVSKSSPSSASKQNPRTQECSIIVEKLDVMKLSKIKQTNLSGFFTKTTTTTEKLVIPEQQLKTTKQLDVQVINPNPEATIKVNKIIPDTQDHGELVKEIDRLGLEILADDPELACHMFGDIAEAVHLYNSLVSLYVNNSFLPRPKKKKMYGRSKKGKLVEEKLRISDTVLEYGSFLRMIKTDANDHEKAEFRGIIRNLLKILFHHENVFEHKKLWRLSLKDMPLHDCMLQELCKIVENCNNCEETCNTETEMLAPTSDKLRQSKMLDLLNVNMSEEAFKDASAESKLQVIKSLCNQVLNGEKFNDLLETYSEKILNQKTAIRNLFVELWERLALKNIKHDKHSKNIRHLLKSIGDEKGLAKLEEMEEKLKVLGLDLSQILRFAPLGIDAKEQVYWYFPCFKQLVVERKTEDLDKSSWYYLPANCVQGVIDLLKKHKQDNHLLENLNECYEKWISNEIVEEGSEKMNESDNDTIPDEEEEDWKKIFAGYERRSTRNFNRRQALEDIENMSDNIPTDKADNMPTDKADNMPTEMSDNLNSECGSEWHANINKSFSCQNIYTLDNLLVFVINKASFTYFYGNSYPNNYQVFKAFALKYKTCESFEEKFECAKEVITSQVDLLVAKYRLIFFEIGKKGVWKDMVLQSRSLSNLYMLVLVQFHFVNWKMMKITPCEVCEKKGDKFEKLESMAGLEEYWKEEEEGMKGFLQCRGSCLNPRNRLTHRKCFESVASEDQDLQFMGENSFLCSQCALTNANKYEKKDEEPQVEEVKDEDDRSRKSKTAHNYDETTRYRSKFSDASSSHSSSASTCSFSDNENEFNPRKGKSNGGVKRVASMKAPKPMREELLPTRSSGRILAARTEVKKPNYADDGDEDEFDE